MNNDTKLSLGDLESLTLLIVTNKNLTESLHYSVEFYENWAALKKDLANDIENAVGDGKRHSRDEVRACVLVIVTAAGQVLSTAGTVEVIGSADVEGLVNGERR